VRAPAGSAAVRVISAAPAVAAGSKPMHRRALLGGLSLSAACFGLARAQSALGTPSPDSPPAPAAPVLPHLASQIPKLDDTIGPGFNRMVIARWGDALLPEAPSFAPAALTQTQAQTQFPYDMAIAGLLSPPPAQDGIPRLVLVLTDPAAPARMLFADGLDHPAIAGQMQGATICNLQYLSGRWVTVDGGYQSQRIADGTLCQISGPVAASIGTTVQGVLAPQAGCATPWGTVLLTEGHAGPWLTRLANVGFGFADPADATKFEWVVELDALSPGSFPTKRTALGRFARSGIAATSTPDGRPVLFMAQDDPAGCLFRFIAASDATDGTALDSGTLSVAQIQGSAINWVDLGNDIPSLAGAVGAAASAGGSPFSAPAGLAIAAGNAALYLACSGDSARSRTDALNPRAADANGHILRLTPPGGDVTAKTFPAALVLAAGNPAADAGTLYAPGSAAWLTRPHTLNLDPDGNLWIGTDQNGIPSATADGFFIMQTAGPSPGLVTMAYLAPIGAAAGGAAFDAATRTAFAAVRHPGATPNASFSSPATSWPTLQPGMPPQSTIIGLVRA